MGQYCIMIEEIPTLENVLILHQTVYWRTLPDYYRGLNGLSLSIIKEDIARSSNDKVYNFILQ